MKQLFELVSQMMLDLGYFGMSHIPIKGYMTISVHESPYQVKPL
jgi:hypothetical protein